MVALPPSFDWRYGVVDGEPVLGTTAMGTHDATTTTVTDMTTVVTETMSKKDAADAETAALPLGAATAALLLGTW